MLKKYLAESSLIIFSVLFALLINKLYTDHLEQKRATEALIAIKSEIKRNQTVLKGWQESHKKTLNTIRNLNAGNDEELKKTLSKGATLDYWKINGNRPFVKELLMDTSWQTALRAGTVKEFKFHTTQSLTEIYAIQSLLTDVTLQRFSDFFFDSQTHDLNKLDQSLNQLQLLLMEITGQENTLATLYKKGLQEVKE